MSHRPRSFGRFVFLGLWFPLLLAALVVRFHATLVANLPPAWVSLVQPSGGASAAKLDDNASRHAATTAALAEKLHEQELKVKDKADKLAAFKSEHQPLVLTAQQSEQADALKLMLAEKRHLTAAIADPVAVTEDKTMNTERLGTVDRELSSLIAEVGKTANHLADLQRLQADFDMADRLHRELQDRLDHLLLVDDRDPAGPQIVNPLSSPLIMAGATGFLAGLIVLMFMGALWVVVGPRPPSA